MKNSRYNKHSQVFKDIKLKLQSLFPQGNMKIGMHTDALNLYDIGYIQDKNMQAVSACVGVEEDRVSLRIFRPSPEGPTYKVDMITCVDQSVKTIISKSKFDHYIYTDIPENIMGRNHISIEFVLDENKNFVPKLDDKGMMKAFINFEDPV